MRRKLEKKEVDKTSEKKKRDALVNSIATEEAVLTSVKGNISKLRVDEAEASKKTEAAIKELGYYLNEIEKAKVTFAEEQKKLLPLSSQVGALEARIEKLVNEEVSLKVSKKELESSYSDERKRMDDERSNEIKKHSESINLLKSEISLLEARKLVLSSTESQISDDIASKMREKDSLDASLSHRTRELAQINLNLAKSKEQEESAKKKIEEIDSQIQELENTRLKMDDEIKKKNEEVLAREKEVENKRAAIIALVGREKKLGEKEQKLRDLFDAVGLEFKM